LIEHKQSLHSTGARCRRWQPKSKIQFQIIREFFICSCCQLEAQRRNAAASSIQLELVDKFSRHGARFSPYQ